VGWSIGCTHVQFLRNHTFAREECGGIIILFTRECRTFSTYSPGFFINVGLEAIRNQATYARPTSGSERSRFAYVHRELFEQGNLCPYPTEQLENGSRLHDL
jgi:hypothetical protein